MRLSDNSPYIDTGIDVGLDQDIVGNRVSYGSGVDLGAYEYQSIYPPRNVRVTKQ